MTTGNRSRSSLAGTLLSDFGVLPDTETTANTTKIQDALIKPTVCLDATSLVVCSYECDDGKIGPTRCAVIGAVRGDR